MKTWIIFLISAVFVLPLPAATAETREEQIQVAFTADVESVIGFAERDVKDIRTVVQKTDIEEFNYNPETQRYETSDGFYAFAQIFTTQPVVLTMKLNPLVSAAGDSVPMHAIVRTGSSSQTSDSSKTVSSSDAAPYAFYEETSGSKYPRIVSRYVFPYVTSEDTKSLAVATYDGSIVIELKTIGV